MRKYKKIILLVSLVFVLGCVQNNKSLKTSKPEEKILIKDLNYEEAFYSPQKKYNKNFKKTYQTLKKMAYSFIKDGAFINFYVNENLKNKFIVSRKMGYCWEKDCFLFENRMGFGLDFTGTFDEFNFLITKQDKVDYFIDFYFQTVENEGVFVLMVKDKENKKLLLEIDMVGVVVKKEEMKKVSEQAFALMLFYYNNHIKNLK
jgi:hypothetical protein